MTKAAASEPVNRRPRKMAREPNVERGVQALDAAEADTAFGSKPTKRLSKSAVVLGLLSRTEGATLDQLVEATNWLPHTTRAALTGLRKKGHVVTSEKVEGSARVYRVVPE